MGCGSVAPSDWPTHPIPTVWFLAWVSIYAYLCLEPCRRLGAGYQALGLRCHPHFMPLLQSDPGQATWLVWPFDNYIFRTVNVRFCGGGGCTRALMFPCRRLSSRPALLNTLLGSCFLCITASPTSCSVLPEPNQTHQRKGTQCLPFEVNSA